MAILKSKEISKMNAKEIDEKVKELQTELIKTRVANKSSKTNPREIRKTIARLETIKNLKSKETGGKK